MGSRLIHVLAFVRKELVGIVRQPVLVVLLVLGLFLVMLLFGAGLLKTAPEVSTTVVARAGGVVEREVREYAERPIAAVDITEVTQDLDRALRQLRQGDRDLVVAFPDDIQEQLAAGRRPEISFFHLAELGGVSPGLFVSPFQAEGETVVQGPINISDYYAPAVLVLLAQHLAVTFLGLSVVRDTELGTTELLRVAPVSAAQVLAGKALAYLLLTGAVAAALVGLLVAGLGVPVRGGWLLMVAMVGLVLLASVALGFVLALAARSVAYAMLLLLGNVFFSGFLLSLDRYAAPVRYVPRLLPATYGIEALRDVMLRGQAPTAQSVIVLAVTSALLLALAWLLLHLRLRRGRRWASSGSRRPSHRRTSSDGGHALVGDGTTFRERTVTLVERYVRPAELAGDEPRGEGMGERLTWAGPHCASSCHPLRTRAGRCPHAPARGAETETESERSVG